MRLSPTRGPYQLEKAFEFNSTRRRRARVRFSIAHEIAHTLFSDVADQVRHRDQNRELGDDWQLEMLCNLAAAEFVMPIGSMPAREQLPAIEELMLERQNFDVSAEAFLIRVTKITEDPVVMFCASPIVELEKLRGYRVDYTVQSKSAAVLSLSGRSIPSSSVVYSCTAIGFSDRGVEKWFSFDGLSVECVGIPAFPGSSYPRVAGLLRSATTQSTAEMMKFVNGDVLKPRGSDLKVICQLVNDRARIWGGGVARSAAKKFPHSQRDFSAWIVSMQRPKRLGQVHFARANDSTFIASLIGQEGYGPSLVPRIRYAALEKCFERVSRFASDHAASVHMPRLGAGESGGSWDTVEEIVQDTLVTERVPVVVYDLPREQNPDTPRLF